MAFERMYGTIGPQRSDLQNGNIVSLLYNMNRAKNTKALQIGDAMQPQWEEYRTEKDKPMSADQVRAQFAGFTEKKVTTAPVQ